MSNKKSVGLKNIKMIFKNKILIIFLILIGVAVIAGIGKTTYNLITAENAPKLQAFYNSSGSAVSTSTQVATITSASVEMTDGTEPFDTSTNDGTAGYDVSESNNIVRTFDYITYNVTVSIKSTSTTSYKGGSVYFTASLPKNSVVSDIATWAIDEMAEDTNFNDLNVTTNSSGNVVLTGYYNLSTTTTTAPSSSSTAYSVTIPLILQVNSYDTSISSDVVIKAPTITLNVTGQSSTTSSTVSNGDVTVTGTESSYRITLVKNRSLVNKTAFWWWGGVQTGGIYSFSWMLEMYNSTATDEDKGIMGLLYPSGDITFKIRLNSIAFMGTSGKDYTPKLYSYTNNDWNATHGIDSNYYNLFKIDGYTFHYNSATPLGEYDANNPEYTVYNPGNISITESTESSSGYTFSGNTEVLTVTISDYSFNHSFPSLISATADSTDRTNYPTYTSVAALLSTGYIQMYGDTSDLLYYYLYASTGSSYNSSSGTSLTIGGVDKSDNVVYATATNYGTIGTSYYWSAGPYIAWTSRGSSSNDEDTVSIGTVVVYHYLQDTTTEIADSEIYYGVVGDKYETNPVTVDGYELVETPSNASETYSEGVTEVIYYYEQQEETTYTVKYIDKYTNETVQTSATKTGYVDATITETAPTISGYDTDGETTKSIKLSSTASDNVITFYYKQPTTYTINCLDEKGNVIYSETVEGSYVGQTVTVSALSSNDTSELNGYTIKGSSTSNITLSKTASDNVVSFTYTKDDITTNDPSISKTGANSSTVTSLDDYFTYYLKYSQTFSTVKNETIVITLVDTLPLPITNSSEAATCPTISVSNATVDCSAEYNETAKTITWIVTLTDMDTYTNGDLVFNFNKTLKVKYDSSALTGTETSLVNKFSGSPDSCDGSSCSGSTEDPDPPTVNIIGTVKVKYVDSSGNEIYDSAEYTGKAGASYSITPPQTLDDYELDSGQSTATGHYTEDEQVITFTYTRVEASTGESNITKTTSTTAITSKNQSVSYNVEYSGEVINYKGDVIVTITDTLPYAIDTSASTLNGGVYDEDTNTITWTFTESVNTYASTVSNGTVTITESISYTVAYVDIDLTADSLKNSVTGYMDIETIPDSDDPDDPKPGEPEEDGESDIPIEVSSSITVKYIGTFNGTSKTLKEETTTAKVGSKLTVTPTSQMDDYVLDSGQGTKTITYTESDQVVTFTYTREEASVSESNITKVTQNETTIVSEEQKVGYKISYTGKVSDYKGDVIVTITDTLPYAIDTSASTLNGGVYDEDTNTITWTFTESVNTYASTVSNGTVTITESVEFTVDYVNIDLNKDSLTNSATGYMDIETIPDSDDPDDPKSGEETTTKEIEITAGSTITVKYIGTFNGTSKTLKEETSSNKVGTSFSVTPPTSIDDYTLDSNQGKIETTYDVADKEITFTYTRVEASTGESNITKTTSTTAITSKNQSVDYNIQYSGEVINYKGNVIVTIIDTLPYKIDTSASTLNGGVYDEDKNTITWTFTESVNTYASTVSNGTVTITESISYTVAYVDIDLTANSLKNSVTGYMDIETISDTGESDPKPGVPEEDGESVIPIEVDSSITVKYIGTYNGTSKTLKEETTSNKVGTSINITPPTSIDDYELDSGQGTKTVTYTESDQVITFTYSRVEASVGTSEITKTTDTTAITGKIQSVDYNIQYSGEVSNYKGDVIVTIIDTLPCAIDTSASTLNGGVYDEDKNTITWTFTESVNTYASTVSNGTVTVTKSVDFIVEYVDIDLTDDNLTNTVTGYMDIETIPDDLGSTDDPEPGQDEEKNVIPITVGSSVIIKYVGTFDGTTKTIKQQTKTGKVGTVLTITPPSQIDDYVLDSGQGTTTITYTEDNQEITFTYTRETSSISEDSISKTSTTTSITDKTTPIPYTITYNATINDYIGTATISIVDKLPCAIDESASTLNDGVYDEDKKTITWTITVADIDTYNNPSSGIIEETIDFKVVYSDLDASADNIVNSATASIDVETLPSPVSPSEDAEETIEIGITGTYTIKYVDENGNEIPGAPTNNQITEKVGTIIDISDEYSKMLPDEIEGYDIDTSKIPEKITIEEGNHTISITYKLHESKVTTHYYIQGTTTSLCSDKVETLEYGSNYTTSTCSSITEYDLVTTPSNTTGVVYRDDITVTYYYTLKNATITIKYLDYDTKDSLGIADYTYTVPYTNSYNTEDYEEKIIANIPNNYKLVNKSSNYSGTASSSSVNNDTNREIIIYYYSQKVDSNITSSISKTGSSSITSLTESIPYTITYDATIGDYIGAATITITDTLPYAINESASDLDGGIYDPAHKTITWSETIDNIDTYTNTNKTINITKNISLVYSDLTGYEGNIVNSITSKTVLDNNSSSITGDVTPTELKIPSTIKASYYRLDTDTKIKEDLDVDGIVGEYYTFTTPTIEGYELYKTPTETVMFGVDSQEISYYYTIKMMNIAVDSNTGGKATGSETIEYGSNSTDGNIVITPDSGYYIKTILVNGEEIEVTDDSGMVLSAFYNVTEDISVEVVFESQEIENTDTGAFASVAGMIAAFVAVIIVLFKSKVLQKFIRI